MYSIKILNSEAEGYSKEAESILSSLGHLKQGNLNRTSLIEIISEYDVLIVRLGNNIDKEIIDAGVNLKAIVTATTGLNHIDVTYANEKNINVIGVDIDFEEPYSSNLVLNSDRMTPNELLEKLWEHLNTLDWFKTLYNK